MLDLCQATQHIGKETGSRLESDPRFTRSSDTTSTGCPKCVRSLNAHTRLTSTSAALSVVSNTGEPIGPANSRHC
jgi:hypothetical protein